MMINNLMSFQYFMNQWWFWPFLIWLIVWKGLALWRAARNNSKGWFVALLVINTVGILEILYIFVFGEKKAGKESGPTTI